MGDLVNLRTARKRALRKKQAEKAAENRLVHGRPKAERLLQEARSAKADRTLDLHRVQTTNEGQTGEGQ